MIEILSLVFALPKQSTEMHKETVLPAKLHQLGILLPLPAKNVEPDKPKTAKEFVSAPERLHSIMVNNACPAPKTSQFGTERPVWPAQVELISILAQKHAQSALKASHIVLPSEDVTSPTDSEIF